MAQIGPAGYAVPHDAVFFFHRELAFPVPDHFFQFISHHIKELDRFFFAPHANHQSHVVVHTEAAERRRLELSVGSGAIPGLGRFDGGLHNAMKPVIIKRLAADFLQLADSFHKLSLDIINSLPGHLILDVIRHINTDQGDFKPAGKVFIPFDQGVANVIAYNQQIRQRHVDKAAILQIFVSQVNSGIGA